MAVQHLKQAAKTPESETATARSVVVEMLAEIERRGEPAVREYAAKLDGWNGEILVTPEEVERRTRDIPQGDQAGHRVRHRAGAPVRARASRVDARVLGRARSRAWSPGSG